MLADLRYAARNVAKNPAFSLTAIAALALGIGANTAIFGVVNQVLLNPAGVSNPERIVVQRVKYDKLSLTSIPVSVPDFADLRNSAEMFESAAVMGEEDFNYTVSGIPERLRGAAVTSSWFDVFGAKPRLGRLFQPEEDRAHTKQVVILSYPAWKRLFGQDAGILGRTIELNQKPYRVIGVMGPEFRWPSRADLWVPLGLGADDYAEQNRFNESFQAVARVNRGVALAQAKAFVDLLTDRVKNNGTLGGSYAKDSRWGMFIVPFTDFVAGDTKAPMLILLGAVGFVLLIACANIAGLMLARASGRAREIAVRAALGASRWALIRQIMAESVVLALAGAVSGLALAYGGVRGLLMLAPRDAPVVLDVRVDSAVLLFTALIAIAAALLFGIAPALQISRVNRYESLKEGGRSGTAGLGRQRLRASLVIGEVGLALLLLVGAGLFLRSFATLQDVSPGFQPGGVITANVTLPAVGYSEPAKQAAFYRAALSHLSSLPGVATVSSGFPVPFSGNGGSASFTIEGRPSLTGDPGPHGDLAFITPDYFATLKVPLIQGRVFTDRDQQGSEPVIIVDNTLVKQYWPNESAIGKHVRRGGRAPWSTIVGVVGHVKQSDLAGDLVKGKLYYPILQQAIPMTTFLVRAESDSARLAGPIREAIRAVDPTQPVSEIRTMSDLVSESLAPRRFVVTLLGVFAGMALLLAMLGLYGVTSYSVMQRTQEIGIRMALGAQPREILGLIIGQGMRLAGAGVVIGLAGSVAVSRLLRTQLFHVSPFDAGTFTVTAIILIGATILASYIPAHRATRVNPLDAVRHE